MPPTIPLPPPSAAALPMRAQRRARWRAPAVVLTFAGAAALFLLLQTYLSHGNEMARYDAKIRRGMLAWPPGGWWAAMRNVVDLSFGTYLGLSRSRG